MSRSAPLERRRIVLAAGAPESGKTTYVKRLVAADRRRLVWDPMRQYDGLLVRTAAELLDAITETGRRPARIRYVPRSALRRDFEVFCLGALAWRDCTVIVEELADVSNAGKAPDLWGRVLRESRHHRLHVYATTQRPAESDKTILGCMSSVAVFQLPRRNDRESIAYDLGIDPALLDRLEPLQFVETDPLGNVERGRLRFA